VSTKQLTPLAAQRAPGASYEAWIKAGWDDEKLRAEKLLEVVAAPPLTLAEAEQAFEAAMFHNLRVNQYSKSAEEKAAAKAAKDVAAQALKDAKVRARAAAGVTNAPPIIISTQQLETFKGCIYVQDLHAIMVPGEIEALDQKRFDVKFSGVYQVDIDKTADSAWDCFTASRIYKFPRVGATYFDPRDPPGYIRTDERGGTAVNTFVHLNLERIEGEPRPFINHIRKILPKGNDASILIAYLAACVQYPGVKSMWAPLLQGVEGNGKSVIVEVMSRAVGRCYTHAARASEIDGRFNSYLYGKLFVAFNEVKVTQDKQSVWETLKGYITDPWQQIEYKGGAIVQRELTFNILFATNHTDALPKTKDARRICPLFCAQQSEEDLTRDGMLDANGRTSIYFDALYHWLEKQNGYAVAAHYLATYPIPDDLNFAGRCKRAPRTSSTDEAIEASMGLAEQEVLEAVENCTEGFRGGWIASHRLKWLLDQSLRGRIIAKNKRRDMLKALGYVPHPGLREDGRSPISLPDGQRPRLYVKAGHHTKDLQGVAVTAAYLGAQNADTPTVPVPPVQYR
jgi:hypothetical protein